MSAKNTTLLVIAAAGLLAACAPRATVVTVEPTYDKLGNASCPDNYYLSVDVCLPYTDEQRPDGSGDSDNGGSVPGTDPTDPTGGNGTTNQNNNQNTNQNRNTNRAG